jgi:uncharacterized protein YcgL (UPF0745 family)
MLCYSFFFENMLIPVSKAFKRGDDNGSQGLQTSLKALAVTAGFYIAITALVDLVVWKSEERHNYYLYIAIFHNFEKVPASIFHVLVGLVAVLQAMMFFQILFEQACILVDQLERNSITNYVNKARRQNFTTLIDSRS